MKKKILFLTFSACILASFVAILSAQTTPSQLFKELHQQISAYKTNTIIPILTTWKSQLDKAMTKDDLAKLNDLRSQAAALRIKSKQEMQQLRQNKSTDKEQNQTAMKDLRKENITEFKALAEQLKPIAEKYKSTLEAIGDVAKPKVELWKTDIKQITDNWKQEHKDELAQLKQLTSSNDNNAFGPKGNRANSTMGTRSDGANDGRGGFNQGMNFIPNLNKKTAVARFMLWDGKDVAITNPTENQQLGDTPEPILMKSMVSDVSNYPNPASDKSVISFNNPVAQNVTITLIDSEGRTVATIHQGKISTGQQNFNVDASNLISGNYIYKIKSDTWTKTGMMIIEK